MCTTKCTGALFDVDSEQAHAAFRFEMERYNNISASTFKLDKYEKTVDVTNSFQLAKAGQYEYRVLRKSKLLISFCHSSSDTCRSV